uniref:Uncharacterized protein n=1 Tax=Zea mays TaxID=4577 RepID=A0A804RED1_MAIZE
MPTPRRPTADQHHVHLPLRRAPPLLHHCRPPPRRHDRPPCPGSTPTTTAPYASSAAQPRSLDSEFLVSTSIDGYARIWKIDDGAPLVNLTRSSDEKIECCRFSRDGMKPFMFCTVAKEEATMVTSVLFQRKPRH